jgi:hypothetical protein
MGLESWFRRSKHMESGLAIVDWCTPRQQREIGAPEKGLCAADGELIIIYGNLLDFGTLSKGELCDVCLCIPAERYKILGSMNITGFGSRIDPSRRPFA